FKNNRKLASICDQPHTLSVKLAFRSRVSNSGNLIVSLRYSGENTTHFGTPQENKPLHLS
ncbi:hypothetical protein, partial [Escherichia coli]|uniref:hypothetical protein n=1 Tax=Escherichia coli TaxID=562 RepID=UPI001BAF1514